MKKAPPTLLGRRRAEQGVIKAAIQWYIYRNWPLNSKREQAERVLANWVSLLVKRRKT